MIGNNILIDTNIIINLFEGNNKKVLGVLNDKEIFVSCITEIEILGYHKIKSKDIAIMTSFFNQCGIINLEEGIKNIAIKLKQRSPIKLPDAIIAATAIFLNVPLVTFDKGFEKIVDLPLILLVN